MKDQIRSVCIGLQLEGEFFYLKKNYFFNKIFLFVVMVNGQELAVEQNSTKIGLYAVKMARF